MVNSCRGCGIGLHTCCGVTEAHPREGGIKVLRAIQCPTLNREDDSKLKFTWEVAGWSISVIIFGRLSPVCNEDADSV